MTAGRENGSLKTKAGKEMTADEKMTAGSQNGRLNSSLKTKAGVTIRQSATLDDHQPPNGQTEYSDAQRAVTCSTETHLADAYREVFHIVLLFIELYYICIYIALPVQ